MTDRNPLPGNAFSAGIAGAGAIGWASDFGRSYQVEACTNLVSRDWQPVGAPVIGTGGTSLFTDATNGIPARFYRVRSL